VLAQKNTKLHAVLWRKKSWAPQLLLRFLRLTNFCRGFIVTDLISVCWSVPAWSSGLRFIPDSSLIYVSSIKFTAGPDACRLSPWRFKTQHSFLKIQGSFISRSPPSILLCRFSSDLLRVLAIEFPKLVKTGFSIGHNKDCGLVVLTNHQIPLPMTNTPSAVCPFRSLRYWPGVLYLSPPVFTGKAPLSSPAGAPKVSP
jgi:hypothetical protein